MKRDKQKTKGGQSVGQQQGCSRPGKQAIRREVKSSAMKADGRLSVPSSPTRPDLNASSSLNRIRKYKEGKVNST
jgi:hypothetical protein